MIVDDTVAMPSPAGSGGLQFAVSSLQSPISILRLSYWQSGHLHRQLGELMMSAHSRGLVTSEPSGMTDGNGALNRKVQDSSEMRMLMLAVRLAE